MKNTYIIGIAAILFSILTLPLFAQQQEPMADRLEERFKTDIFSLGILLQSEGYFSFNDDNFNGGRKFDIGATRLDVRGNVDNGFLYRFQLDFRRQTSVLDAQVGYRFSDTMRIIGGAFKPFLSADLDPNPGDTDFMNRARQVGTMMNSREIGLTLLGEPGKFNYRFGMYNGTGLTRSNDNRFMYTARLGYTADLNGGTLELGFNGAYDETRMNSVGNTGLVSMGDRVLYGGFIKLDTPAIFGTAEILQTKFDAQNFGGNEETITGFYATLGSNVSDKDQLLVRWDYLDFDLRGDSSDLITFGWNHQATRLISFQLNFLALLEDDEDTQFGVSGVMQFQF
ncbi:MAG: hypothetical protein JJU37_02620 [Balneolaceae bacterium]|nr:hypothetical protein [Balneolaceae bacterium]